MGRNRQGMETLSASFKRHMNQIQETLDSLPSSLENNSRKILLDAVLAFKMNPCDRTRKKLESFGIAVDQDDRIDHMGEFEQSDLK